jgi:predicted GNAT superfamily acetyltransferase
MNVHVRIRDVGPGDSDAIFRINADALPGVAVLTPEYFEQLMSACAMFRLIEVKEQVAGYLCAMNRYAAYDGEEFQWFHEHFLGDFLYIDQVAVWRHYRGRGLGRALYDDLEHHAHRNGIDTLVCEVNREPFNVASQSFHQQRGFSEVGRMETHGVLVSLLAKRDLSVKRAG